METTYNVPLTTVVVFVVIGFICGIYLARYWLRASNRYKRDIRSESEGSPSLVIFEDEPEIVIDKADSDTNLSDVCIEAPQVDEPTKVLDQIDYHVCSATQQCPCCKNTAAFFGPISVFTDRIDGNPLKELKKLMKEASNSVLLCMSRLNYGDLVAILNQCRARIQIITNDLEYMRNEDLDQIKLLVSHNVSVKYTKGVKMNCKYAIIDGAKLVHGSMNWTEAAIFYDHEHFITTETKCLLKDFSDHFEHLWKVAEVMRLDDIEKAIRGLNDDSKQIAAASSTLNLTDSRRADVSTQTLPGLAEKEKICMYLSPSEPICERIYDKLCNDSPWKQCPGPRTCNDIHENTSDGNHSCELAIALSLASATTSIDLCMFLLTYENFTRILVAVKNMKGVRVRVIANGPDQPDDHYAQLKVLKQAVIQVKVAPKTVLKDYGERHVRMHHKYVIIDSKTLLTGSLNWTKSALRFNNELVLSISDPRLVNHLGSEFEKLWSTSNPFRP